MAAGNVSAALVVTVVFSGLTWRTPWRVALEAFAVALLFSFCIGPAIATIMPRLGPRIWCRWKFPLNWAAMIVVMLVIAAAGSLLAISILTAIGYLQGGRVFAYWFAGALRVSIIITLTFGILITAYEMMRAQLDATTLALRTKERDEAEARRIAAEAQLASIESRVQPHFLFNTLNSIAALVHDDPASAERMTGQLASLLRSALDSSANPLVTLDEELRWFAPTSTSSASASAIACVTPSSSATALARYSCRGWVSRRWSRTASSTLCLLGPPVPASVSART